MSKVALVTDSTTYPPPEYLEQYTIRVVPATIIWSGQQLRDGVDIQPEEFYTRLKTDRQMHDRAPGIDRPRWQLAMRHVVVVQGNPHLYQVVAALTAPGRLARRLHRGQK